MRPVWSVCALFALVACGTEPDTEVVPAEVNWMEWPAEVLAATPFTVRLVGYGADCREILTFDPAPTVNNSAVTFEPFFLVSGREEPCILRLDSGQTPAVGEGEHIAPFPSFFDTRAPVPGLAAQNPRTYEIRAASDVVARLEAVAAALPVRTFGEITVRSDIAEPARTNAGGHVYAYRDEAGCLELYVLGAPVEYVLENPPDTASFWAAFVRGYLYRPAASVCGEEVVFHLVSRN